MDFLEIKKGLFKGGKKMKKKIIGIGVCMLLIITTGVTVVGTIEKNNEPQNMEKTSDDLVVIWDQPPDETPNGINVCCDQVGGFRRVLAMDFPCDQWGYLVEIHLFGSWRLDDPGLIEKFNLSIYSDTPADQSPTEYSMPNESLWSYETYVYTETLYFDHEQEEEYWWDPYTGELLTDKKIYEYNITIPWEESFLQKGTKDNQKIYWLAVHATVVFNSNITGRFGLKSAEIFQDDAVMWVEEDPYWIELFYPPEHPYHPDSLDFAGRIRARKFIPPIVVEPPRLVDIGPFGVTVDLINTGNETIPVVPWKLATTGTSGPMPPKNSTASGVVENLGPGESTTVKTNPVVGLGSFDIMVTVMDYELITLKSFIFLFLIINKKWLIPT